MENQKTVSNSPGSDDNQLEGSVLVRLRHYLEHGDEQEVIDCLYLSQRALMDYELKIALEADGVVITVTRDWVNIRVYFTHPMINNMKMTEEGLSSLLHSTVTTAWAKIR